MLKNYLLVAWRNALSHIGYTSINIVGLSLGIAVTVLLLLVVIHEWSYDDFHHKKEQIYRIRAEINYGDQNITAYSMSAPFGVLARESVAGIENYVRLREPGRIVLKSDEGRKFFEDRFIFADSSFLTVFSFQLLEGDKNSLSQPSKVFVTPEMAQKYFGEEPAVGQYLTYQGKTQLEVVGIIAPAPSYSSIKYDFVASFPSLGLVDEEMNQYEADRVALGAYPTFLLLQKGAATGDVEQAIARIVSDSVHERYTLEPLKRLPENVDQLLIFSGVALLVLVLALVNYMNLTTARATTRAKEVGLRKVAGASSRTLVYQFYLESAAMTVSSFVVAGLIIMLALPHMKQWVAIEISTTFLLLPEFCFAMGALLLVCVFLAGSYPVLVISTFKPASVLKGQQNSGRQGVWIRKGLTTFQFAVSMVLIFASLVIQSQLTFLRNREIGINKDQVLVVKTESGSLSSKFYNQVASLSSVDQMGQATVSLFNGGMPGYFTKTPTTNEEIFIQVMTVDNGFFNTLGIPWQHVAEEGIRPGDVVTNETGLEKLKIEEEDMGVDLKLGNTPTKLMGVTKDFNYTSLKQKIDGVLFFVADPEMLMGLTRERSLYIRLRTTDLAGTVQLIRGFYEEQNPTAPFEFYFLDDAFNQLYQEEERMARLFHVFTVLAIAVACLGLLGLITFTTARKTREIGIRKVLGASEISIARLLGKDFSLVVMLGCLLAAPAAWWIMDYWLSKFPYRISLEPGIFILSGLAISLLGTLTIAIQVIRATRADPVNSLKSE